MGFWGSFSYQKSSDKKTCNNIQVKILKPSPNALATTINGAKFPEKLNFPGITSIFKKKIPLKQAIIDQ